MGEQFVDYYEVLQLSPNVDVGTIEKVFRYLAIRHHPDNPETGNADQFELIMRAYRTLTDPAQRAAHDIQCRCHRNSQWKLAVEASDTDDMENDRLLRQRLLSLLYVKRRRDLSNPGIGSLDIERLVERPRQILDFHLWYLKQKGWIERTEEGRLAITADGVEQVEAHLRERSVKLIESQSEVPIQQTANATRFTRPWSSGMR
jgi:curved DNA-binding protein CbpA